MTTRLTLVCHASTSALRAVDFPRDEPLDAQGLRKAAALSGKLRAPARAWTSPALRARQTASQLNLDAAAEPLLRDWDFGCWTGRSLTDVQAENPDAVARWMGDPAFSPGGGESLLEVLGRVAVWLETQTHDGGRIAAVTHAAVVRAVIVSALAAPPKTFWHLSVAPLSLTKLSHASGRWTLVALGPLDETSSDARA